MTKREAELVGQPDRGRAAAGRIQDRARRQRSRCIADRNPAPAALRQIGPGSRRQSGTARRVEQHHRSHPATRFAQRGEADRRAAGAAFDQLRAPQRRGRGHQRHLAQRQPFKPWSVDQDTGRRTHNRHRNHGRSGDHWFDDHRRCHPWRFDRLRYQLWRFDRYRDLLWSINGRSLRHCDGLGRLGQPLRHFAAHRFGFGASSLRGQ